MLSDRTRNTLVGLTILLGIGVSVVGVAMLGRMPAFLRPRPYLVTLEATNASGLPTGAKVDFNGVIIGSVRSVELVTLAKPLAFPATFPGTTAPAPASPALIAQIELTIDADYNIPASATVLLKAQTFGIGSPSVSILATQASPPFLAKDGSARIAAVAGDNALIPREVFLGLSSLQDSLNHLSEQFTGVGIKLNVLLESDPKVLASYPLDDPRRHNVATMIQKLNNTLDALNKVVSDPEFKGKIQEILRNVADASAQLKDTLKSLDHAVANADQTFTKVGTAADNISGAATQASVTLDATRAQILRISDRLVETLAAVEKSTTAITSGKGTTGKLVNDPRLYDSLVDLSASLKTTVEDLSKLVRQWKQEGVPLKLK